MIKKYINNYYILKLFFIFLICIFILSGCKKNNDEKILNDKINAQLNYLENYLLSMLNSFNNISYTNYRIEVKKENSMPISNISQDKMLNQGQSGDMDKKSEGQNSSGGGSSNNDGSGSKSQGQQSENSNIVMTPNSILLNNISEKKLDWNNIKYEIENIYLSWNTLFIDLNSSGQGNKDTLQFSNILNDTTKSIKDENKIETMRNLARLYAQLAKYAKEYTSDNTRINIFETKSNIIDAYVLVSDGKWESAKSSINRANETYGNIINNILQNKKNQASVNKSYVLIKESEKAIDIKDKDIFYINYKMLMQELDNI